MANGKFFTLQYETAEDAAAMAARINTSGFGGPVRAISNGTKLEVATCNLAVADLSDVFAKFGERLMALFGLKGSAA